MGQTPALHVIIILVDPFVKLVTYLLHSSILGMELASAFMFWSTVPLYACAITAVGFAIKMPYEVNMRSDSFELCF